MTKSIENIPACNELNSLAMDLIGRLNTSEHVNGGMPPSKVSLHWSVRLMTHLVGLEVQVLFHTYTEPHLQRKMFLEYNFNSRIFKTKFGVVIFMNVHVLPVHTSQLTILPRFTEHWYVRSKPVLLRCTCIHGIFFTLECARSLRHESRLKWC